MCRAFMMAQEAESPPKKGRPENDAGQRQPEEKQAESAKQGAESPKDAEVLVEKSSDGLRVTIQLFPPLSGGAPLNREKIDNALSKAKVSFGIDDEAIEKAIEKKEYLKPIQVAVGTLPIDGQDAQLIFHYSKKQKIQDGSISNLQRVDYKELGLIINVAKQDLLIEKIPATVGSEGRSVTGKVIRQTKGKDLKTRAGKGVTVSEDGLKFFADMNGQVLYRNSQISVENVLQVDAVGAKTGNIKFSGSVVVKSLVQDGYSIDATADVRISGNVGAAQIVAGGNIIINGGVLGGGNCRIHSKRGNFYCKFVQDANVIAEGDITVEEYVRNSMLKAGGKIELTSDKPDRGFVMGGRASAVDQIICNNVGSTAEVRTELTAGVDGSMVEEIGKIKKTFSENERRLEASIKILVQLQQMRIKSNGLDQKKREMMIARLKALVKTRMDNAAMLERFRELLTAMTHRGGKGAIRVKKTCYSNVSMAINGISHETKTSLNNVLFKEEDGEVQQVSF